MSLDDVPQQLQDNLGVSWVCDENVMNYKCVQL